MVDREEASSRLSASMGNECGLARATSEERLRELAGIPSSGPCPRGALRVGATKTTSGCPGRAVREELNRFAFPLRP